MLSVGVSSGVDLSRQDIDTPESEGLPRWSQGRQGAPADDASDDASSFEAWPRDWAKFPGEPKETDSCLSLDDFFCWMKRRGVGFGC